MDYKIPLGEVNHIQPVTYFTLIVLWLSMFYVSSSRCRGLVCILWFSVNVAFSAHTHFLLLDILNLPVLRRAGGNRNGTIVSQNVEQKSFETEFSIAICRRTGDKLQS